MLDAQVSGAEAADQPVAGVVVIGRNEGERLKRCLASIGPEFGPVVYVDSGSTDGSVAHARSVGAQVLVIDPAQGFTAARARNLGWRHLVSRHPHLQFIQFVDGDCEVAPDWLAMARAHLRAHPSCAGVCGRRRERFPQATVYNALCDVEWNTPVGPALATGGDAMFRVAALQAVGGYRDTLIAGEEPELCLRLRERNWSIERLDGEMTLHDAAMTRFGQWWKRSVRTGHAFAEGHFLHGGAPHHHYDAEVRRCLVWAVALPAASLVCAQAAGSMWPLLLTFLGVYPLQIGRLWRRLRRDDRVPAALAPTQAILFVVGKFAEFQGWIQFQFRRLTQRQARLIEYK